MVNLNQGQTTENQTGKRDGGLPVQITRVREGLDNFKSTSMGGKLVHTNSKVGEGAENREHLSNKLFPGSLVGSRPAVEVHDVPNNLLRLFNIDHDLKG